jgi:hypothetical protein
MHKMIAKKFLLFSYNLIDFEVLFLVNEFKKQMFNRLAKKVVDSTHIK